MERKNETRIVVCSKCGIRTRHEWRQWERQPLLLKVIGHLKLVEGWVCTKCGRQSQVRQIGAVHRSARA